MNIYELVAHCNTLDLAQLTEFVGSYRIYSKLILKSINADTNDIVATYELDYPRFIHAEVLAHAGLPKNAQSSRAVPTDRVLDLNAEPVYPVIWGSNQPGMASHGVLSDEDSIECKEIWESIFDAVAAGTDKLKSKKLHKQWTNRPLEPFSNIKVVLSGSNVMLKNFFWLRIDPDAAQPEIILLALLMQRQYNTHISQILFPGEWHLPYIDTRIEGDCRGRAHYYIDNEEVDLETAKKVSASCCAQASYRRLDTSIEKAVGIYDKLFNGPKPHASPVHHQCTPIAESSVLNGVNVPGEPSTWQEGITHMNRDGSLASGHFRGFIQLRQVMGV